MSVANWLSLCDTSWGLVLGATAGEAAGGAMAGTLTLVVPGEPGPKSVAAGGAMLGLSKSIATFYSPMIPSIITYAWVTSMFAVVSSFSTYISM